MASGASSLSDFIRVKKDEFVRTKIKPVESADALAEALIEELTATIPGRGAHPNATGNMLKAITKRTKVEQVGYLYIVGVGDLELLGRPGEKRYKSKPIARFLKQYNEEAEAAYKARREREAEYRRGVAERRAAREAARAERERRLAGTMPEYVAEQVESIKKQNAKESRQIWHMERTIELIDSYIRNYRDYFENNPYWYDPETKRWHGYNQKLPSYQVKKMKRANLAKRKEKIKQRIAKMRQEIMTRSEALVLFMQHWEHPYGPYQ